MDVGSWSFPGSMHSCTKVDRFFDLLAMSICTCSHCTLLRSAPDANIIVKLLICVVNVALTPVLLIYHSFSSYVVPCFLSTTRCFMNSCCRSSSCCASWWTYTDSTFKPDNSSLGNVQCQATGVRWIRIPDLLVKTDKHSRPVLFDETIEGTDVCQGALGDCWLLAAFATLCERKTFIQNIFVTSSYNPFGKYTVRLYDQTKKQFYNVTIDDYVPCDSHGRPLFCKFNGHEMWPLLLEKAYAKSKGSYAAIEGGRPLNAMIDLTGYQGEAMVGPFNDAQFAKMKHCIDKGCLLAAGSHGVDNTLRTGRGALKTSIAAGHAYSVLKIKTPHLTTKKLRLLKIRNPWGGFEWDGDWSDNSPLWNTHTGVALEIGKPEKKEDGIFYMCWEDFIKYFTVVDVLYPNYGMDNIHFRVVEQDPYCGNCRGCAWGCLKYWCCCKGLRTLWFERSSAQLKAELDHHQKEHMMSVIPV